jgi:hypothetical protein
MGVAHLLDVAGAHETLTALAGRRPMLDAEAVRLFAVENITTFERSVIDRLGLNPDHAPDERDSFGRLIETRGDVLGGSN